MTDPASGAPSNILDRALATLAASDPALAAAARREVESIRDGRRFGLVFNRHLPESVRLPGHPIKRGVKVTLRNPVTASKVEKDASWRVSKVETVDGVRVAHLVAAIDTGPTSGPRLVTDLVVVREFGEPVYPGLKRVESIRRGGDAPVHTVINGENHHVLQSLLYTHRKAVDLIYIDPPYNTGNEGWIYSDRYVAEQDGDKHSKWLSFMERRLLLARDLLKDTGVIIVAIGDDEHHRLRMLMDQVFGKQNFISDVVWQGGTKSYARYTSNVADYMLVYAKDEARLTSLDVQWRETKSGVEQAMETAARIWNEVAGDVDEANRQMRDWFKTLPGRVAGIDRYDSLEEVTGRLYSADGDMGAPEARPNRSRKALLHPVTGKPCPVPPRGWRWSEEELDRRLASGSIAFGPDEKKMPRMKRYLDEMDVRVVDNVFAQDRNRSGMHVAKVLGDKRFPFPKDHEVLMRWIRLAAPTDAVVLDFFGGSGTTAEAVMRLNAEDGGTRQALLVTNNEVGSKEAKALTKAGHAPGDTEWEAKGVFEYVTRPRISAVATGIRPDGSTYSEGLNANVDFFEMTYLDEARVQRAREFEAIAPLLWLKAGGVGDCIAVEPTDGWEMSPAYAVLTDIDAADDFIAAFLAADEPSPHVYVVTDSDAEYADVAGRLPSGTKAHQLYASYLRNFEINVEGL